MKNQTAKSLVLILALVLGMACVQSAPAQSFKKTKVAGGAPIAQVASGGASVWALASNGNPYRFNGKTFVLANTISLSQIAVGGGNAAQADEVWALNSSGSIFRAHKSGTSWVFSQVTGVLDGIMVGPGYQDTCHPYEVWGLNTGSEIFRYNFCGNNFEQEPGFLCDLHVGGGDIWGAQCGPNVFRFNFSTGVFDPINSPFVAFPELTVGPNGEVWVTDTGTSGDLYRYDPFFAGFRHIVCCASTVQAGGDGVWALSGNNVYRSEPNTLSFVQVPGSLVSISVGSGGGVWGINSSHQVFAFSTP
ncbi:MAG TPA: tectonin domain-containing protein [Terriglobales bacterium]|nr:tectonin domain-containing protein [Terriglobales bacterium]